MKHVPLIWSFIAILVATVAVGLALKPSGAPPAPWTASDEQIVAQARQALVASAANNGMEVALAQFNAIYHVPNSPEVRVNFTVRLANSAAGQVSVVLERSDYRVTDIRASKDPIPPSGP